MHKMNGLTERNKRNKIMKLTKIFFQPFLLIALLAYALTLLPITTLAQTESTLDEAIELHNKGREGNTEATAQAVEALKGIVKKQPSNALAVAYLGSSYGLTARDSSAVVDKIRYTNRSLRFLDQAVAMAPDDFTVRFIRVNVTSKLPEMFGRGDGAVKDMLTLDKIYTPNKRAYMAALMIDIYQKLEVLAKDKGDWSEKADEARVLAKTK